MGQVRRKIGAEVLDQLHAAVFHLRHIDRVVDVLRLIDLTDSQSPLTCLFGFRSRFERIGLLVAGFLVLSGL